MRQWFRATFFVAAMLMIPIVTVFSAPVAQAQNLQAYEFEDPAQEALFRELINELRCPKCQNQSIADSNAELAVDLRDRTYLMVRDGASKQQVIDFMVARYGDFVHYQPPMNIATSILWWGPLAVLVIGAVVIVFRVKQQRQTEVTLSEEEQAQLATLRVEKKDSDA